MRRYLGVLLLLVVLCLSSQVKAAPTYTTVQNRQYVQWGGHLYTLSDVGTWDEAQADAVQAGLDVSASPLFAGQWIGSLVKIDNPGENNWLLHWGGYWHPDLNGQWTGTNEWGPTPQLWIGARDVTVEGVWVWVDGTDADVDTAFYQNWGDGEPTSDPGGMHEMYDCDWATIRYDFGGTWNDYNVTNWQKQGYGLVQGIIELTPVGGSYPCSVPVPGSLFLISIGVSILSVRNRKRCNT